MSAGLQDIHDLLLAAYGAQRWWPADSPFEVMLGAILTQNTNWRNVEKAIANLKHADALNAAAILDMDDARLRELIRPSGFFNQKAER
ncbi:MAG: endonuclease III domain-containing protein, partial [Mariprofundaceae bacterium]|nr:endonuclease III domain-containing protein [Mariprofundaceae bacterium]